MAEVYHIVAIHTAVKVDGWTRSLQNGSNKEICVRKTFLSTVTVVEVLRELGLTYEDILIGKIEANITLKLDELFPPTAIIRFQKFYPVNNAVTAGYRVDIKVEKVEAVE